MKRITKVLATVAMYQFLRGEVKRELGIIGEWDAPYLWYDTWYQFLRGEVKLPCF